MKRITQLFASKFEAKRMRIHFIKQKKTFNEVSTPYYAKKYRKYTIEKAIPIFKEVEMGGARAIMEREK